MAKLIKGINKTNLIILKNGECAFQIILLLTVYLFILFYNIFNITIILYSMYNNMKC